MFKIDRNMLFWFLIRYSFDVWNFSMFKGIKSLLFIYIKFNFKF